MDVTLPSTASIQQDENLEVLSISNEFASARISLFGAHILSFIPKTDGRDRLWLSPYAIKDGKAPIRGGIPVCWPWFSDSHGQQKGTLPSHGYVRNQRWTIQSCEDTVNGTAIVLIPTTTAGPGFSGKANLSLEVLVGKEMVVSLNTTNAGESDFTISGALHTYFAVSDVHDAIITGLSGVYKDKTRDFNEFTTPTTYTIAGETDRVHLEAPSLVNITGVDDIGIGSEGHDSIVVWNPGAENARNMKDMTDDGYLSMLCVETAVTTPLTLKSGDTHSLTQRIQ